jgi:predicted Zn-ribbon and HTH transcriptional regulator
MYDIEENQKKRDHMSTPYESAKRFVERVYTDIPQCPICKSKIGYVFSGWINDYIQCRNCRAKWLSDGQIMILLKAPENNIHSTDFEDLIGKAALLISGKA